MTDLPDSARTDNEYRLAVDAANAADMLAGYLEQVRPDLESSIREIRMLRDAIRRSYLQEVPSGLVI